jgi:thioester reductase-like protein
VANYTLLTGGTGLLGRFLIWDLLERNHRLAVLIRPGARQTAEQRLEEILQLRERRTGRMLARPVYLAGDVRCESLGLQPRDAKWVSQNCSRLIHNAAVLTFHGKSRDDEPWKTNVGGTGNVLEACLHWGVGELHHVSTAYVCGTRSGVIGEVELDCGQAFRNDYEHSKFVAEKMVRAARHFDHVTVYRPVVIGGDSSTGYTNTYHGVYTYLRLMSVLVWNVEPDADGRRYTPVRLQMHGDERRNVAPVDWVSAAICRLLETPEARGGTYHLAPREPFTPRQVIEAGCEYFNSYGVEFCGPNGQSVDFVGSMDRDAHQHMAVYHPYDNTDPTFDTSNLLRFTADLPCPRIDKAMLHRFWRYGERDRWGKRRSAKPALTFRVSDALSPRVAPSPTCLERSAACGDRPGWEGWINLDILGAGGGQWHCRLIGQRIAHCDRGLYPRSAATLRMAAEDWRRLPSWDPEKAQDFLLSRLEFRDPLQAALVAEALFGCLFAGTRMQGVPSQSNV